ncbi:MAG: hypothetical protein KAU03_03750 [Candidatus Altiarchaeales archaeon]|nr:hypothetical protein [Candidatus Altiarchaeales archaeon]
MLCAVDYSRLLNPYDIALNYLEAKDIEILDRLHPEVREMVEEIIAKAGGN